MKISFEQIKKEKVIASIKGNSGKILSYERVLLNLLQRLCGIASLTREYVKIAEPYKVRILDTRKTIPGLRLFEKYAVTLIHKCNFKYKYEKSIGKEQHYNMFH